MRLKFFVPLFLCGIFILIYSCKRPGGSQEGVRRAFYQWGSNTIDKRDDSLMQALGTKVLYVRFFDVDYDPYRGIPYPINTSLNYGYESFTLNDSIDMVPTVFITNETFKNLQDSLVDDLALSVYKKLLHSMNMLADASRRNYDDYYWTTTNPYMMRSKDMRELHHRDSTRKSVYNRITELQFDCDWTESTRDKYFSFLTHIKKHFSDKLISSTVRLYAYKYPDKAGVPPVEKGMLMCYNAGDLKNINSGNTIFNKKEVLSYLDVDKPYPLPLDYALPIFEWCAVYRADKLIHLAPRESFYFESYGQSSYELQNDPNAETPIYKVIVDELNDYTTDGFILKKGDLVKVESPSLTDVAAVAGKLGSKNTNPKPVVSLFHFQFKKVLKNEKQIKKIYDSF